MKMPYSRKNGKSTLCVNNDTMKLEVSAEDFIKFAKERENTDVSFSPSKEPDTFSTYFPFCNDKSSDNSADAVDIVRCKDCKWFGVSILSAG